MKLNFLALLIVSLLFNTAYAQDKSYFLYKSEAGQYEIKSNDHYVLLTRPGLVPAAAAVYPDKIFDLRNNVGIYYNEKASRKWYYIESTDTILNKVNKLENMHEQKVINGHKCDKYKADTRMDAQGGLYGLHTYEFTYAYIIWIATDMKPAGKLSRILLSQITGGFLNADVPGVPVRLEMSMSKGKKDMGHGTMNLDKSTETTIKDSDVKLPWTNEEIKAAMPEANTTTSFTDHGALFTDEDYKPYVERLKKLYSQITGTEVKKLIPVRMSPFF